jgi:hypothetical protein
MAMDMCKPKNIEEVTVEDLQNHRWCYYQNDEEGFDCFEHVVPDNHPGFSEHGIEFELAEFTFSNGKSALGSYDGSESFFIHTEGTWRNFWCGVSKPESQVVDSFSDFLLSNGFQLPVVARAKWSGASKTFKGLQFIGQNGEVYEIAI